MSDGMSLPGAPRLKPYWPVGAVVFAAAAIGFALICAFRRGGWADEYSTIYFADPTVTLGTLWAHIWPTETNPPFFYLFARYWAMLTGPSLFARRLINLIPLLFLVSWFLVALKNQPQHRSFLVCLILLAFSSHYFMWFFPEYRSYFSQYCAGLVFLGSFSISYLNQDKRIDIFQLAALPVLINFHQVTALYTGVLLLVVLVTELNRANYSRAISFAVVAAVSAIPVAAFLHMQLEQSSAVLTKVSWITRHGPIQSFVMILKFLPPDLGKNWIAIILALAALALPKLRARLASLALIRLILIASLGGTLIILIVNHFSPIIIERYLNLLAAELIVATALAIAPLFQEKQLLAALVTVNAALYLIYGFHTVETEKRWSQDGATLAKLVSQCPQTRIHAGSVPPKNEPDPAEIIGPPQAEQIGLDDIAARYHLKLLPLSVDVPGTCPVVYWTEFRGPSPQDIARNHDNRIAAANETAGFGLSEQSLQHAKLIKTSGTGAILILEPN
jgi:hypothetical protein